MPNAAVVAAALTDHSAHPYMLTQGGLDVIRQPGGSAGVILESIRVTEAGPNGVSSMDYTIEDPLGVIPIPIDGTQILFQDVVSNHPEFLGYIQGVSVRPFPPTGRYVDVSCQGVEAVLDWVNVSGTFAVAANVTDAWQVLAATSGLRDGVAAGGSEGTQDAPIAGTLASRIITGGTLTITNQTLREAISAVWATRATASATDGTLYVTVDFTNGLRIWHGGVSFLRPDDYIALTIVDTYAGATLAENLSYEITYGEIVRQVRVIGSSDWGNFSDGTGKPGPTAVINDSTITSVTQAQAAAQSYMGDRVTAVRGSFNLTDFNEGATAIHAGAIVHITDSQVGLSASDFVIGQIVKTYDGNGTENWAVTFGGLPPRGSALLRRLTRGVLS